MSKRIRIQVGNKVLMVERDWNISRKPVLYLIGGKPEAYNVGHSLSPEEAAEAFYKFEEAKGKADHAAAAALREHPRFRAALKRAEENEGFETLERWNGDASELVDNFGKYLDAVKSPEELKAMKKDRKEAKRLEADILSGKNQSLSDFARVKTTLGKKAFRPKPKPKTEDEEMQEYYDSMVTDAQADSDRHRLAMLEKKAEGKEGLSVDEAGQLMSLRNAVAAADAEGSGDE